MLIKVFLIAINSPILLLFKAPPLKLRRPVLVIGCKLVLLFSLFSANLFNSGYKKLLPFPAKDAKLGLSI